MPYTNDPSPSSSPPRKVYSYYHAAPLFTQGDLLTNILLSRSITRLSHGKFVPILPQDLEQRSSAPHAIRDNDLRALLDCDLALFTYDGAELDAGTVVEYMFAKMADLPSVVLRTDFRGGGDQSSSSSSSSSHTTKGEPWNLMSSFYPRTQTALVDGMMQYKTALLSASDAAATAAATGNNTKKATREDGDDVDVDFSRLAAERSIEMTARLCVEAFEAVLKMPARMPKELRQSVFRWLALMPGLAEVRDGEDMERMEELLREKERKGLF